MQKLVDGKVTNVIVAEAEFFDTFIDGDDHNGFMQVIIHFGGVHKLGVHPIAKILQVLVLIMIKQMMHFMHHNHFQVGN